MPSERVRMSHPLSDAQRKQLDDLFGDGALWRAAKEIGVSTNTFCRALTGGNVTHAVRRKIERAMAAKEVRAHE